MGWVSRRPERTQPRVRASSRWVPPPPTTNLPTIHRAIHSPLPARGDGPLASPSGSPAVRPQCRSEPSRRDHKDFMEVALVYFAVLLIAFFMFIVRPQRRRMAAHRQFVAALRVGDEVVTTGGIFGTVRTLEDDRVELEVAPGVLVKLARAAVAQ